MQNSDSIAINKAITQRRIMGQWGLLLLVLLVLGLACVLGSSKREPPLIYPQMSLPDGSLVFTINGINLFKLDSSNSVDEPIIELYHDLGHSPFLSPDTLQVVFVWQERLPEKPADPSISVYYPHGLYLLDFTGDQPLKLLWRSHNGAWQSSDPSPFSPQWSPDGKQIVFLLGNSEHQDVYKLNLDNQAVERLFKCEDYCHFVISAPASNRLLLTSLDRRDAKQPMGTLLILEEDGTTRLLVADKGIDYVTRPSWSPDESQIVFTMQVDEEGYRAVFLINSDGTGLLPLTTEKGYYYAPVWSPDGKMLAFVQKTYVGERVASRIILMDLESRELQTLLATPTQLDDLQWLK